MGVLVKRLLHQQMHLALYVGSKNHLADADATQQHHVDVTLAVDVVLLHLVATNAQNLLAVPILVQPVAKLWI